MPDDFGMPSVFDDSILEFFGHLFKFFLRVFIYSAISGLWIFGFLLGSLLTTYARLLTRSGPKQTIIGVTAVSLRILIRTVIVVALLPILAGTVFWGCCCGCWFSLLKNPGVGHSDILQLSFVLYLAIRLAKQRDKTLVTREVH